MKYCLSMWESFLYETWIEPTKKAYALVAASCLCTGSLLILKKLLGALYRYSYRRGCGCSCCLLSARTDGNGKHQGGVFYSPGCLLLFPQSVCSPYYLVGRKKAPSTCMGRSVFINYPGRIICVPAGRNITGISSSEAAISSVNPAAARNCICFLSSPLFCSAMRFYGLYIAGKAMAERTDPVVPDKHSRRLCCLPDFLFQAGDCPDSFLPASFYGGNSRMLYQPWERNGICYPSKKRLAFFFPLHRKIYCI